MDYKGYNLEAQLTLEGYICVIRKRGSVVHRIGYCGYSSSTTLSYGKNWVDDQKE